MSRPMWITVVVVALALLIAVMANRGANDELAVTEEQPALSGSPAPAVVGVSEAGSPATRAMTSPGPGSPATVPEATGVNPTIDRYGVPESQPVSAGFQPPPEASPGNRAAAMPGSDTGAGAEAPESLDVVSSVSIGLAPEAGSPQVQGLAPESSDVPGAQMLPPEGADAGLTGPGPGEADAGVPTIPPES